MEKEKIVNLLEDGDRMTLLTKLTSENFEKKENFTYRKEDNSFRVTMTLGFVKSRQVYQLSYSFLLNSKDEPNMYEISWKLEEDSIEKIIPKFISVLDKVEKRRLELKI